MQQRKKARARAFVQFILLMGKCNRQQQQQKEEEEEEMAVADASSSIMRVVRTVVSELADGFLTWTARTSIRSTIDSLSTLLGAHTAAAAAQAETERLLAMFVLSDQCVRVSKPPRAKATPTN